MTHDFLSGMTILFDVDDSIRFKSLNQAIRVFLSAVNSVVDKRPIFQLMNQCSSSHQRADDATMLTRLL